MNPARFDVYFLRKVRYNKESPSDLYFSTVCGTFRQHAIG